MPEITINKMIFHSRYFFVYFFIFVLSFSVSQVFAEESLVNVSNTPEQASYRHQIFVDGNFVYFVWQETPSEKPDIFFSRSIDGGKSFEEPINLSNNIGGSHWPRLTVSENDVYVTWYDYTSGISEVYFSRSSDKGKTFETINLSQNVGVSFNPWISASGDNVYVVWMDDTPNYIELNVEKPFEEIDIFLGNTDILLATSNDRGLTFEITNLSKNPTESGAPRMILSDDNIYVVWRQTNQKISQILFTTNNDKDLTFSPPISLSHPLNNSFNAGILVEGKNIYVNWNEKSENKSDIFFVKSSDGGNTFDRPRNISNGEFPSEKTRDTQMAFSNNVLYVIWSSGTLESSDIFLTKSADKGKTFSQPVSMSNSIKGVKYPQVVAFDDYVDVMWFDNSSSSFDVYLRSSNDRGNTFGNKTNISSDSATSILYILGPHLAITKDGVFTSWQSVTKDSNDIVMKFIEHEPEIQKEFPYWLLVLIGLIIAIPIVILKRLKIFKS